MFGQLLIYGALYLPVSLLTCLHCLSSTGGDEALCPGGGGGLGGGLRSSLWWGGSPCLLCCLPSHFMAPSVPCKLSSGDVLAHQSRLTVWISSWYIYMYTVHIYIYICICCWECISVYIANWIFGHSTESFLTCSLFSFFITILQLFSFFELGQDYCLSETLNWIQGFVIFTFSPFVLFRPQIAGITR